LARKEPGQKSRRGKGKRILQEEKEVLKKKVVQKGNGEKKKKKAWPEPAPGSIDNSSNLWTG